MSLEIKLFSQMLLQNIEIGLEVNKFANGQN
jgi:hypothetical protein